MNSPSLSDRYQGCLLGLACGDAVGCAAEFLPRHRFKPLTDMVGGGKFGLQKGEWTDDTSMAICLASSLIETQSFDPVDQMRRYLAWAETGAPGPRNRPVGIGKTVLNALFRFRRTGEPYAGISAPHTAGNGALMRLAPVVLAYYPDYEKVLEYSKLSTLTTHAAEECVSSSQLLANVLIKVLSGGHQRTRSSLFVAHGKSLLQHMLMTSQLQVMPLNRLRQPYGLF